MNGNAANKSNIQRLPGAHILVKQAWQHYKERWATFLGVMIIPMVCSALAVVFLSGMAWFDFHGITLANMGHMLTIDRGLIMAASAFVVLMIIIVIQSWGHVALLYAAQAPKPISIGDAFNRSRHLIISYWWVMFLTGLAVSAGLLCFIIPGIIFFIWYHLAPFVLVAENVKGSSALSKSHQYVKGHWWSVLHRQVMFTISITFITGIAVVGLTVLLTSLSQALAMPILKNNTLIAFIGHFIAGVVAVPLTAVFWFMIYQNLKALKK